MYIISSISDDGLTFENPIFQECFNTYLEFLNEEKTPEHQTFINHENPQISKLAIDVLTDKYEVSQNWEKHSIIVRKEEHQLKVAVMNTVYAFKLSKLTQLIHEHQNQIKEADNDDDRMILMKEMLQYQNVKKQLADKLGRIVLR